jgi:hypothetical protein
MEYWPSGIRKSGGDPEIFRKWLHEEMGFRFFLIHPKLEEIPHGDLDGLCGVDHHVDVMLMR